MKKRLPILAAVIFTFCFVISGCTGRAGTEQTVSGNSNEAVQTFDSNNSEAVQSAGNTQTGESGYADGIYEGKSALTSEAYYGKAEVTIKNGRISKVDFEIYDTAVFKSNGNSKHKADDELLMDEIYGEEVFDGVPVYQEQTRNELAGMKKYRQQLVKIQDVNKVDAISGATWSYNIFQETMKNTLEKAKK